MRFRVIRGQLVAVSVLAGILAPASGTLAAPPRQPSGSIGIRLVDVPAESRNNPLALTYIVGRVAPGTSIRRQIEIVSSTRTRRDVAVYPAAANLSRGKFLFSSGRTRNELSGWTSVSRPALRLPAGATALETLTVKVPKQASAGERYAVVWVQVSTTGAGRVTLVNRVGIRMYISIGPGGAPPSSFVVDSLRASRSSTGRPAVLARVRNTGSSTIGVRGTLRLSGGPGGVRAGPFPAALGSALSPGASGQLTVRLDRRLPRGRWRAQLQLSSGNVERVATATITFRPR